jgi:hypothetical protein
MNPRVTKAIPQKNYKVALLFDNGEEKIFDVTPYLNKGIFSELKEPDIFYSVRVIDGSIQWQNEADFCPDTLYLESKPI